MIYQLLGDDVAPQKLVSMAKPRVWVKNKRLKMETCLRIWGLQISFTFLSGTAANYKFYQKEELVGTFSR